MEAPELAHQRRMMLKKMTMPFSEQKVAWKAMFCVEKGRRQSGDWNRAAEIAKPEVKIA